MNPLKWLLTKAEPVTKEAPVTDITASEAAPETNVETPAVEPAPVAVVKTGVKDFEAALSFVESGVAKLGEAAKAELKALAQKYL
ncbi:hypothetical protein [Erwinia sp. E_sp_B04_7]|uniref:hypothetical protein n=1 Tax=unclassified Erwinia TaxID=2622719 RepID=UPI0030CEB50A